MLLKILKKHCWKLYDIIQYIMYFTGHPFVKTYCMCHIANDWVSLHYDYPI